MNKLHEKKVFLMGKTKERQVNMPSIRTMPNKVIFLIGNFRGKKTKDSAIA